MDVTDLSKLQDDLELDPLHIASLSKANHDWIRREAKFMGVNKSRYLNALFDTLRREDKRPKVKLRKSDANKH